LQQEPTGLSGVIALTPRRFADDRGWFSEVWSKRDLALAGITCDFVQDNHSLSLTPGTLRGLHYQRAPHAQAKLVRCTRGAILDVAVDARRGSPSYGQWVGVELSAENGRQLFIPEGFLHGFVTRAAASEVQYKCSAYYAPECDGAVRWDTIGIDWGLAGAPVLSPKDAGAPTFADWLSPFSFEGAA